MGEKVYLAGTCPPPGWYKCMKCDYKVEIQEGDELEICPWCGAEEYERIEE